MAFYNFVFCTSTGDEVLYEQDSDLLMENLKVAVDGPNRSKTILLGNEKVPERKEVFDELVRIRGVFKDKITGFEICDSFQYSKERKFSIEFLDDFTIEVCRLEEQGE